MSDGVPCNNQEAFANMLMSNGASEPDSWFGDPFTLFTNMESDMTLTPATTGGDQSPLTPPFPQGIQRLMVSDPMSRLGGDEPQELHPMPSKEYPSSQLPLQSVSGTTLITQPRVTVSLDSVSPSRPSQKSMTIISEMGVPDSSPGRKKRRSRRRSGSSISSDDESKPEARAKQMHTAVERRYRDNLNRKFEQLSKTLKATGSSKLPLLEDTNRRTRKVDVLADAVGYINRSEVEIRHMSDEIRKLNERLRQSQGTGLASNQF